MNVHGCCKHEITASHQLIGKCSNAAGDRLRLAVHATERDIVAMHRIRPALHRTVGSRANVSVPRFALRGEKFNFEVFPP